MTHNPWLNSTKRTTTFEAYRPPPRTSWWADVPREQWSEAVAREQAGISAGRFGATFLLSPIADDMKAYKPKGTTLREPL
jgi:hypothetical protein